MAANGDPIPFARDCTRDCHGPRTGQEDREESLERGVENFKEVLFYPIKGTSGNMKKSLSVCKGCSLVRWRTSWVEQRKC